MSKIIIPTMRERFYCFMKDLKYVKTFNGVKALTRKNFTAATRFENEDGTIHVFLGSGLEIEIKEQHSEYTNSYNDKFVCILKDINHRILYQGEARSEIMLWQAVSEKKRVLPFVETNLAFSKYLIEIPDVYFSIQEVAENALC